MSPLNGRDHYLGSWPDGVRKPPAIVQAAYDALIVQWLAAGRHLPDEANCPATVSDLILQFWERHAQQHYRHPDGTPTSEIENFKLSLRPLRKMFGAQPAADFSPLKFKAVRQKLIEDGISRGVINQRMGRIRWLFKWGVAEELIPETVYRALLAVDGLKAGRSMAKETAPVKPVSDEHVGAVLPTLPIPVQAMVKLQRFTGMRPGEVTQMRWCDIDCSTEVWTYRPARHKTAWRGRERIIPLGPRAQAVLEAFRAVAPADSLFSPKAAREERFETMRSRRRTKVQPSQRNRRKSHPQRQPADAYDRNAYASLIARACKKCGVPHWHPNQLRHSRATEVRGAFGLEAAQVLLGHARANITEVYAEKNLGLASLVAERTG